MTLTWEMKFNPFRKGEERKEYIWVQLGKTKNLPTTPHGSNETKVNERLTLVVDYKGNPKLYEIGCSFPIAHDITEILEILKSELPLKKYLKFEKSAFENCL